MKFHRQKCHNCKKETIFLEKLVNPMDGNCREMEDVCTQCHTAYYVKEKLKIKPLNPNNGKTAR